MDICGKYDIAKLNEVYNDLLEEPSNEKVDSSARKTTTEKYAIINQLIEADTDDKIRDFAKAWHPFTFRTLGISTKEGTTFEEIRDTRNLMLLALGLKQLIDNETCTRENLEEIGAVFPSVTSDFVSCEINYLIRSTRIEKLLDLSEDAEKEMKRKKANEGTLHAALFLSHISGKTIKKRGWYLPKQQEDTRKLNDSKKYPILKISANVDSIEKAFSEEQAYLLLDGLMRQCLRSAKTITRRGKLTTIAPTRFTALWICLAESFNDSRIGKCVSCGLPIIADRERGERRRYCSEACSRKGKRARKFERLTSEGISEKEAGKQARIAVNTAKRVLENEQRFS